jgi:hypothetical protein
LTTAKAPLIRAASASESSMAMAAVVTGRGRRNPERCGVLVDQQGLVAPRADQQVDHGGADLAGSDDSNLAHDLGS